MSYGSYFWPNNLELVTGVDRGCASLLSRISRESILLAVVTDINLPASQFILDTLKQGYRWKLIIAINPAGATRQVVLDHLIEMQKLYPETLEVRVLLPRVLREQQLNINVLFADNRKGEYWLNIGSCLSLGFNTPIEGTANLLFKPDAVIIDECRKFLDLHWKLSIPLKPDVCNIPHLIPAQGTEEARAMWAAYEDRCLSEDQEKDDITLDTITVNENTGEVTSLKGEKSLSEAVNLPRVSETEFELIELMKKGKAATVDYKVPPLQAPISPSFFGIHATERVGTVTRKTQYSVDLFDEETQKKMDGYRKGVREILTLCSFRLADGLRWVPDTATEVLHKLVSDSEAAASQELKSIINEDIDGFIATRETKIRESCEAFYNQLVGSGKIPDDKFKAIIKVLRERAEAALKEGLLPKLTYTCVSFSARTNSHNEDPWSHAKSLLEDMVVCPRNLITNPYERRRFNKSVTIQEYLQAMDVLGDCIIRGYSHNPMYAEDRANRELQLIQSIGRLNVSDEGLCQVMLMLIRGTLDQPPQNVVGSNHLGVWLTVGFGLLQLGQDFNVWEKRMVEFCGEEVRDLLGLIWFTIVNWPKQEKFNGKLLRLAITVCLTYVKTGESFIQIKDDVIKYGIDEKKANLYFEIAHEAVEKWLGDCGK